MPVETGVAYFANRMPRHIREDMRDVVEHHCTYVLHTFSENDFARHREVMKDIVRITHDFGLKVWLDSWGMGRVFAGEVSGFCGEHPEAREVLSDGAPFARACLYAPEFRKFMQDWTDAAAATKPEAIFWDEPNLPYHEPEQGRPARWGCRCERCQSLFRDRFGHAMPVEMDEEVIDFRHQSVVDFLDFVTKYAHTRDLENAICCMIAKDTRFGDKNWDDIISLPAVDNFGTDPYCHGRTDIPSVVSYYSEHTRRLVDLVKRYGKAHHIWVQAFGIKAGCEQEIVDAIVAVREAGSENIAAWGFAGCESNDYRCQRPEIAWEAIGEGFRRLRWQK